MTPDSDQGALERAIEAAQSLGLDVAEAQVVARTIAERQGYPSDLYVLGLAGGTGVGKSTLLNAIAGADISAAGARRPTTRSPWPCCPLATRPKPVPCSSGWAVRRSGHGPAQRPPWPSMAVNPPRPNVSSMRAHG